VKILKIISVLFFSGKFGHEFLEFEFRSEGRLRYANNSSYKHDTRIRKETYVSQPVLAELSRIVEDSEIMKEDDNQWPVPDRVRITYLILFFFLLDRSTRA
jgi:hypothetical protein